MYQSLRVACVRQLGLQVVQVVDQGLGDRVRVEAGATGAIEAKAVAHAALSSARARTGGP